MQRYCDSEEHALVSLRDRIYRRTMAGVRACESPASGLSLPFRRILSLLEGDTHFSVVQTGMGTLRAEQLAYWLDQLQTLGFVESNGATADSDLDFTQLRPAALNQS